MHELLKAFAEWLQNTSWALAVSGSLWAYPFVQMLHFTGISIWLGTNIGLDLHLLGWGKRRQTSAEFLRATIVWNWIGLVLAVTGGFLLFSTAAGNFVVNPAFEVKIGALLPAALIWHIVVQVKTWKWGLSFAVPKVAKVAGSVEMFLWISMACAAAAIPYF
jgi:hypothetical protein